MVEEVRAIAPSAKGSGWTFTSAPSGVPVPTVRTGETLSVYVDGDIIAYRCAAAANGTFYSVNKKEFKYHKMAKDYCIKNGIGFHFIVKDRRPEPFDHVKSNIDSMMANLEEEIEELYDRPVELVTFLTGSSNFRHTVNPLYKSSRSGTDRPYHLKMSKRHLEVNYDATYHDGLEADDLMVIHATNNSDSVIASIDKDLLQCPGSHYDFIKKKLRHVSHGEGKHLFWCQVLTGDKTDDIVGLHGIGPVKANKILEDCTSCSDFQYYVTVIGAYLNNSVQTELEDDEDYYVRIIRQVTYVARQINLLTEFNTVWMPPKNENLSVIEKLMSLETATKKELHKHLLFTKAEESHITEAFNLASGLDKTRFIDAICQRLKVLNTIVDDPMLSSNEKVRRVELEEFSEDGDFEELLRRRNDY